MEVPHFFLLGTEFIRGCYEFGLGWIWNIPLQFISPKGDGHPVIVIPGLGASDGSTHYLRRFLKNIGYDAHSWGLGRNLGPREGFEQLLDQLNSRVHEVYKLSNKQQISLVGWSLGGIYAREIAKSRPEIIRQVITLGTPFKNDKIRTHAVLLYEFLSKDTSHKDPDIIERIGIPPPVPFTSIYSMADGVVHWKSSLEEETIISENIEIPYASHLGLGHNPISMYVIADRLTQHKESWIPFKI